VLAESKKLQKLNQTLTCLLNNADVKSKTQQLDAGIEIRVDLLNMLNYLIFLGFFDDIVQVGEQLEKNVEHYFKRPLLPVLEHTRKKQVGIP
jgi:hypothetical protein